MATNNDSEDYPPSPTNDESDDETEEAASHVKAEATDDEESEVQDPPAPAAAAAPAPAPEPASTTDNVAQLLRQLQSSGALVRRPSAVKVEPPDYRCVTCRLRFSDWDRLERHLIQHVSLPMLVLERLPSDDEYSSDEDEAAAPAPPPATDIARLLQNTGVSVKRPAPSAAAAPALDKLAGLGFTIKKSTPVKEEKPDRPTAAGADLLQKLGQLGGLKLKLKSDGASANSFKVVNGLKDFKASDDEDSDRDEPEDDDELASADGDSPEAPVLASRLTAKLEPAKAAHDKPEPAPARPARPNIKQTPKRADGAPQRRGQVQIKEIVSAPPPPPHTSAMDQVVVKQEAEESSAEDSTVPLFSGQIKTERASPPPQNDAAPMPTIARVKTETEAADCGAQAQPLFANSAREPPLLPVAKTEDAVIEINGDSNDEDDDCCVVSATPAPDIKPVIIVPKSEPSAFGAFSTPPTADYYNWNRADSKVTPDAMEKSADDLFESLLSAGKKENHLSLSEASEYISLDRLGPQHACEVCNTRFTSLSMLDEHVRTTGHSRSVMAPSAALMPYGSNALMSSLLPVKQLAEQVGKLSTLGAPGSAAFTHQQNVMINIQAYPGAAGMMGAAPGYNAYGAAQPVYPNTMNNVYGMQGQGYQPQQPYGQPAYQPPISKAGYGGYSGVPGASPYSVGSPLQGMQQAVYAQAPGMQSPVGAMGPPPPGQLPPRSSPSLLKPMASPSGVRIQNVQTFAPGQMGVMSHVGQMQPPAPVRVAGPTPVSLRPKLAPGTIRPRPTIRPGAQLQGQGMRGGKMGGGPRMPLKRPVGAGAGVAGGPVKRRPDMLLPGKHDNEDCHVMAMQKKREGLPLIQSVQGAKDKLRLGGQLTITKKKVNSEANAMAGVLAQRGIMVKAKQRSRSPSPERPLPHIPNLGAGVSIKHSSRPASFSIPEARVGGGMLACRVCRKMFSNSNSLAVHMSAAHGQAPSKVPQFRCDECPASYPKSLQLQHHKRVFHNVSGPNRELGLPVVDLSQEENLKRLGSLGIYSFIPLANREQASGCFGIPVLSVHGSHNGVTNSLQALGADGLLSLGPLKPLPNT